MESELNALLIAKSTYLRLELEKKLLKFKRLLYLEATQKKIANLGIIVDILMQFEQIFEQNYRKLMVDELISKGEKCRKEVKILRELLISLVD